MIAKAPGTYSCTFTAHADRECWPPGLQITSPIAKAVTIRPKSVTFGGSVIAVARDDGSGDYPTPHWNDNSNPLDDDNDDVGDYNFPVAYVRNTNMVLSAELAADPPDALTGVTSVTVTGTGVGNGATYIFTGTATVSGGVITLSNAQANVPLPNSIGYLNRLEITWSITPGNTPPLSCAQNLKTKHRVYVLLGTPNTGSRYETLIHLTSTDASGLNTEAPTVAAIWSEFTHPAVSVHRKPKDGFNNLDGQQLTYYANWNCVNTTTAAVLANGDGQCGAWASFFIDMMGAQGINHTNEYVRFTADLNQVPGAVGFAVKNWQFSGNGTSGRVDFPYLNIYEGSYFSGTQFTWVFAEVNDQTGVPGQGNPNPLSLFGNHQVVKFGTPALYYDPSYGVTFGSLTDIDSGAGDAYVTSASLRINEPDVGRDLNHNGNLNDLQVLVPCILFAVNPSGNQLTETVSEYP